MAGGQGGRRSTKPPGQTEAIGYTGCTLQTHVGLASRLGGMELPHRR